MTAWRKSALRSRPWVSSPSRRVSAFAADAAHPTVVELFQSQGCSSCPPAEANVGAVSDRPDVLALAFEVDYWDRLGLEGHVLQACLDGAPVRLRQGDGPRRQRLYAPGRRQRQGRGRRSGAGRARGAHEPRRSRRGRPERRLFGRGGDGRGGAPRRPAARTFGSRAIFPIRSKSRSRAARTPATLSRISTWCAKWSCLGKWRGEAATFPVPARSDPGLAEAAIVQANGAGPILAAAKR